MDTIWTLIIIGIYTCIYVVVFVIQRSQIQKQTALNNTMEKFINILNLDTIEKYVKLSEKKFSLESDEKVKEQMDAVRSGVTDVLISINTQHDELLYRTISFLEALETEDKKGFIEKYYPKNKEFLIELLEKNTEKK